MLVKTRQGHLLFEHDADFRGEVRIVKGDAAISVSMDSLRAFVAESVRYDITAQVARMKPAELLRRGL
jgi:hypothetical protein